jgi:tryptophan synthase beta subunit
MKRKCNPLDTDVRIVGKERSLCDVTSCEFGERKIVALDVEWKREDFCHVGCHNLNVDGGKVMMQFFYNLANVVSE